MVATVSTVKDPNYYTKNEFTTWKNKVDKENYYSENTQVEGQFLGSACKELGFNKEIKEGDFLNLINGIHPNTHKELWKNKKQKYYATDITLSAPKDFSILQNIAGDKLQEQLKEVFNNAVDNTIKLIEDKAYRRIDSKNNKEYGVKLFISRFHHKTARSVNGEFPDMQEHSHLIINRKCLKDGKIYSLDNHFLFINQKYFGANFRYELAKGLRGLGFITEKTVYKDENNRSVSGFSVKGIPDELRKHYSKRHNQIDEVANKNGKATSIDKFNIAQKIKSPKRTYKEGIVKEFWKSEAKELFNFDDKSIEAIRRTSKEIKESEISNFPDIEALILKSQANDGTILDYKLMINILESGQASGIKTELKNVLLENNYFKKGSENRYLKNENKILSVNLSIIISLNSLEGLYKTLTNLQGQIINNKLTDNERAKIAIKIFEINLKIHRIKKKIEENKLKDYKRKNGYN